MLDKTATPAAGIVSPKWLAQVRAERAELLWASDQPDRAGQQAQEAYQEALGNVGPWNLGPLAIWLRQLGAGVDQPVGLPEPYALEITGDWQSAAAWGRHEGGRTGRCPRVLTDEH